MIMSTDPEQRGVPSALLRRTASIPGDRRAIDERRVVTMLFCDIVGSTSMAEQLGPEVWAELLHEALGRLIEPVERYDGTVARLMGDGLLAFFGAPRAHEDDPQRAILAGLAILDAIRPLQEHVQRRHALDFNVRIGISTGLVVVGDFGSHSQFEYTAVGDAINVASRMEETAEPGTIRVAGATWRLTAPFFDFEPLGEVEVRGRRRPEAVYRVRGARAVSGRLWDVAGLDTPLVGRGPELDLLVRAYDELRQGRGQIILLTGEAGLGKSRLIGELRRYWETDAAQLAAGSPGIAWMENRLVSWESIQPYGALQRRLRHQAGIGPDDSAAAAREKVARLIQRYPPEMHERATRMMELVLAIDDDSGSGSQPRTGSSVDGREFKRHMFAVMWEMLRGWNQGGPVVFVGEDYHWFDSASAELMTHLLGLVEEAPILFICTFRPDATGPIQQFSEVARTRYAARCTEIQLRPLPLDDSGALLDELIDPRALAGRLRAAILQRAGGNPLFIEEFVRSFGDQGLLEPAGADATRWRPVAGADLATVAIPDSLQALLLDRLDRLDPSHRQTLQQAAVIGVTFSLRVLRALTDSEDDLELDLATLVRLGLVEELAGTTEREFGFRHALIWETVSGTLLQRKRQALHRLVAEAMERLYADRLDEHAAALGLHYLAAEDGRAIEWLARAAERAQAVHEPWAAVEHIDRANELARRLDAPLAATALLVRGRAREQLGSYELARTDFQHALDRARADRDATVEWRALHALGMVWAERDYERAGAYLREAGDLAAAIGDPALRARSLNRLGNWHANAGRASEAFAAHAEARAIFERLDDRAGLAETDDLLGVASFLAGDLTASAEHYERAIERFRALDDRRGLASSLSMLMLSGGDAYSMLLVPAAGPARERIACGEAGLRIAREIGWQAGEAFAQLNLAMARGIYGDYSTALDAAQQAVRIAEEIEHRQWTVGANYALGTIMLDLEQAAEAVQHLERAHALAGETGSAFWQFMTAGRLTLAYVANHDLARARALSCDGACDKTRFDSLPGRVVGRARASLELASGNLAAALEFVECLVSVSLDVGGCPAVPHLALLRGQVLARLGRLGDAEAVLAAARERAVQLKFRPVLWRIDHALASVYDAGGDATRAELARASAAALIDELGAQIGDPELRARFVAATRQQVIHPMLAGGTADLKTGRSHDGGTAATT
jgi:class 3 adenylate cyclase/predicted ATPase